MDTKWMILILTTIIGSRNADAAQEVELADMLAYADQHAPPLVVARQTQLRAQAERAAVPLLVSNPELSVAIGAQVAAPGVGASAGRELEISLVQPLSIAGVRGARMEAAERAGARVDADIEAVRWAVHCDVHAAFHRALVDGARARLAAEVVAFQVDVLRIVEQQIAVGEAAPLTLRLAQAEVAQAQQVLLSATQAVAASRLQLAQLAGWPVDAPPQPRDHAEVPHEPPPIAALRELALARLPALRAAEARILETTAHMRLAAREAWPMLSIGVAYRRERTSLNQGDVHMVTGLISMPLVSFQRNQGARAKAHADVAVAKAELAAARYLLDAQLTAARGEVVAAAARMRAYGADILPHFAENLGLLRRSFELGEIDLLALSTGRERFLRIQSDALEAQRDYLIAVAGLERVVGVEVWQESATEEGP